MNAIRRAILLCAAVLMAATHAAASEPCSKNHYILEEPCARWVAVSEGLGDLDVQALAIDPMNAKRMFAGGLSALFSSVDGGATWQRTAWTPESGNAYPQYVDPYAPTAAMVAAHVVKHIAIDRVDPKVVYVGTHRDRGCVWTQRRIFRSVDGGAHWSEHAPSLNGCDNIHGMVAGADGVLHVASFDDVMGDTPYPLVRTTDRAESWDYRNFPYLNVLASDPRNPRMLAGGSFPRGWTYDTEAGAVMTSADGGASWKAASLSTDDGVSAIAVAHTGSIYAATFRPDASYVHRFTGISRSDDGGESWMPAQAGLEALVGGANLVTAIASMPGDDGALYLGTSGAGVWRSTDRGATWTPLNAGLESLAVRALAVTGSAPATVYAATSAGVFRLQGDKRLRTAD